MFRAAVSRWYRPKRAVHSVQLLRRFASSEAVLRQALIVDVAMCFLPSLRRNSMMGVSFSASSKCDPFSAKIRLLPARALFDLVAGSPCCAISQFRRLLTIASGLSIPWRWCEQVPRAIHELGANGQADLIEYESSALLVALFRDADLAEACRFQDTLIGWVNACGSALAGIFIISQWGKLADKPQPTIARALWHTFLGATARFSRCGRTTPRALVPSALACRDRHPSCRCRVRDHCLAHDAAQREWAEYRSFGLSKLVAAARDCRMGTFICAELHKLTMLAASAAA